jgi:molybdenum cofactor synthesis domain-containing protein
VDEIPMLQASMLVIGDEILGGFVEDTNSSWLARVLQEQGVPLDRIQTVPDDLAAIDEALQQELGRGGPRLVVTSGGIGSTPDDMTFEAVAASLGRDLVTEPLIEERVETALGWQAAQGLDITDEFRWHMLRMARIPAGGRLLESEGGWVPGVRVDVDGGIDDRGATIVILPGIPSEFRRILEEIVAPRMLAGRNAPPHVVEIEHGLPESALNLCFAEVGTRFPDVKLGSYPGTPMIVRLSGTGDDVEAAGAFVRSYLDDLLASEGGARLAAAWTRRFSAMEERSS